MDGSTSELNNKVVDLHQQEQLFIIPIRDWPLLTGMKAGAIVCMSCFVFQQNPYLEGTVFLSPPSPSLPSYIYLILCVYRGYYTVARRYEFYVRVAGTISHE